MTPGTRTMTALTAKWNPERCQFEARMPDGKLIVALDETGMRRAVWNYVGTTQPVRFQGPIVYPRAK